MPTFWNAFCEHLLKSAKLFCLFYRFYRMMFMIIDDIFTNIFRWFHRWIPTIFHIFLDQITWYNNRHDNKPNKLQLLCRYGLFDVRNAKPMTIINMICLTCRVASKGLLSAMSTVWYFQWYFERVKADIFKSANFIQFLAYIYASNTLICTSK